MPNISEYNSYKADLEKQGKTLVAVAVVKYPTYMLHLELKKPNDDPMFQVDWAIMHFVKDMPCINIPSVSRIIGMEESLVRARLKNLCDDHYLIYYPENGEYGITVDGESDFFKSSNEVYYIKTSKNLLIDGITHKLMDPIMYTGESYINRVEIKRDFIERVITSNEDRSIRDIVDRLNSMTNTNKEKYDLPLDSKEYVSADMPTLGSVNLDILFSIDKKGNVYKEVTHLGHFIKIPELNNQIDKFYFYGLAKFNYGFTNYKSDEAKNKILDFRKDDICEILNKLYGWNNIDESYYTYLPDNNGEIRPLTINVTLENLKENMTMLRQGVKVRNVLKDLQNGKVDFIPNSKFPYEYIVVSVKSENSQIIDLMVYIECVDSQYKNGGVEDVIDYIQNYGYVKARKNLIMANRFDMLEEVDNYIFIQNV